MWKNSHLAKMLLHVSWRDILHRRVTMQKKSVAKRSGSFYYVVVCCVYRGGGQTTQHSTAASFEFKNARRLRSKDASQDISAIASTAFKQKSIVTHLVILLSEGHWKSDIWSQSFNWKNTKAVQCKNTPYELPCFTKWRRLRAAYYAIWYYYVCVDSA